MSKILRATLLKLDEKVKKIGFRLIKKSFPCDSHLFTCYVCHRFRDIFKGHGFKQPNPFGIFTRNGLYIWQRNPHKTLIFMPMKMILGRGLDKEQRARDMRAKIREHLLLFNYMEAARR